MATSNANADLKQPLVVVQDLESSQSSSSSQEEQDTDISKRRVSILILLKASVLELMPDSSSIQSSFLPFA